MPLPSPSALFSLQGRRALVTGAGRGIGRAIALGLAGAGAQVALVARSASELDEVAALVREGGSPGTTTAAPGVVTVPADLADTAALEDLVETVSGRLDGVIDVVVHAAGVQARGRATELNDADFARVLTVNLTAPWRLSTEVARRQLAAGVGGSHVMVASMLAVTSRPEVSPWRQETLQRVPLGRFGQPEDLVGPALLLASDAGSYVTGHLLTVDGGWTSS